MGHTKWTQVVRKAKKAKASSQPIQMSPTDKDTDPHYRKRSRAYQEAILIRPAEGKAFADMLEHKRSEVSPSDSGVSVKALRKTQSNGVLVEFMGQRAKLSLVMLFRLSWIRLLQFVVWSLKQLSSYVTINSSPLSRRILIESLIF